MKRWRLCAPFSFALGAYLRLVFRLFSGRRLAWRGELQEQTAGFQIVPELGDIAELNRVQAESFRRLHIHLFVIDEQGFFGENAKLFAGERVDRRVGLGYAVFAGEGEVREVREPAEFLAHVVVDFEGHVGEDGCGEACVLQRGGPGEHRLIEETGPLEDVVFDQALDLRGGEVAAGFLANPAPERGTVEAAEIVLVPVDPVMLAEGRVVETCELEQSLVRDRIGLAENFSVVEDDGADRHSYRLQAAAVSRKPGAAYEKMRRAVFCKNGVGCCGDAAGAGSARASGRRLAASGPDGVESDAMRIYIR